MLKVPGKLGRVQRSEEAVTLFVPSVAPGLDYFVHQEACFARPSVACSSLRLSVTCPLFMDVLASVPIPSLPSDFLQSCQPAPSFPSLNSDSLALWNSLIHG